MGHARCANLLDPEAVKSSVSSELERVAMFNLDDCSVELQLKIGCSVKANRVSCRMVRFNGASGKQKIYVLYLQKEKVLVMARSSPTTRTAEMD